MVGMGGFGMGFGLMNTLFPIFFIMIFAVVIGGFVAAAVRGARRYAKNEASPVLTVDCTVVSKRADVRHVRHRSAGEMGMDHVSSSTTYYVTFQVESGDRIELSVDGGEYGLLVEGDRGRLTFQGTRYRGFERSRGGGR